MGPKKWLTLTNVYTPPENSIGQEIKFNPTEIKIDKDSIILGDLNGHSPLWDFTYTPDERGEVIEDLILTNNLSILNDGSPTRMNPTTGNESTPDVSLVGELWRNKCEWQTGTQMGSSDHLPIKVTINAKVTHQSVFGKPGRWRRNGVNWNNLRNEVEDHCQNLLEENNLTRRVARFNQILTQAAKKHVGKSKPGRKISSFMTPTVKAALKRRNNLRKKVSTHRKEWLESCKQAQEEITKAKEQSWKDLLESSAMEIDDTRMWKIIKTLNGCPETNSPNEAMRHKGKLITSNKRKANIFAKHYANVSRHKFTKEERNINREAKRRIHSTTVNNEYCQDFTKDELKKAIKEMKRKGAQGPDEIPPTFLK
ncbi:uncharacterized protein [Clytia hemisphaerica]|uniref:uncharacterized protein n=1 Tax=Clytia hemisphaerica TaxID=252671 RepID=UPI0034D54B6B